MTQEQKDLLLKDLCSRIPYGVKIDNFGDPSTLISINNTYRIIIEVVDGDKNSSLNLPRLDILNIEDAKPYLFPLSSMTEEQMVELKGLCNMFNPDYYYPYAYWGIGVLCRHILDDNYKFDFETDVIDWFHKNHIDYRGLIPMDLAIDATGLNIY